MTGGVLPSPDPTRGLAMLATALGAEIGKLLTSPDTIEVIANPDGRVWVERHGIGRRLTDARLDPIKAERVIRLVATLAGVQATRDRPIVSAELPPRGERFEGVLPPVSRAPCFAIRKPAGQVFTLEDYVTSGVISAGQRDTLKAAVRSRTNIIVAGGTGSGKTTLANALLAEIAALNERVVILEDTRELQCAAEDVVALRTQAGSVTLSDLVRSTLRLRPDRIVVGEVRGPEALDLLKAWNTGHPGGIATVHANSAPAALARLEQLAMEASQGSPAVLIAEAVGLVVFIERGGPAGRLVSEIYAPGLDRAPDRGPAARGRNAHQTENGALP
jgi:type IV secretion system protein TrbB